MNGEEEPVGGPRFERFFEDDESAFVVDSDDDEFDESSEKQ